MTTTESPSPSFRERIFQRLKERNGGENPVQCYKTIIDSYQLLNDRVFALNVENTRLNLEVNRLQQQKRESVISGDGTVPAGGTNKTNYNMEQKIFQLQEEMTNLYREKSTLASQVLDLNKVIQDKDRVVQQKNIRINELETLVKDLRTQLTSYIDKTQELEVTVRTLRDELAANSLYLQSQEQKHREVTDNYNELLARYKKLQNDLMEQKNAEHDVENRRRRQLIQQEISEAASIQVHIEERDAGPLPTFAVCTSVVVPTHIFKRLEAHDSDVNCVRWSPSGKMFATGSTDRRLKLWSFLQGNVESRSVLIGCNQGITAIDFDIDESHVLAGSNDYACRVWSCADGRVRGTLTGHSNKVLCAKFMLDSSRLVTGSGDRTLRLWDVKTQTCYKTLLAQSACHDVVYCGTMNLVVSGHFDKKIRMWDARKENPTDTLNLSGRVTGLDILQDRPLVLAATRDDTLQVWDLRGMKLLHTLQADGAHVPYDYNRPCFSPDGTYACLGSGNGALYIWNVHSGRLVSSVKGDETGIACCHWNPNGTCIITCDRQKNISIWSD